MKRLIKASFFTENQVKDAVNKAKHFKKEFPEAVANAQKIMGKEEANSYLMALILKYNGKEDELQRNVRDFLFNGNLEHDVYKSATQLRDDWSTFMNAI